MDRIIVFDLGNILVKLRGVELFWPEFQHDPVYCQNLWNSSKYVYELETGKINDLREFYNLISQELKINLDFYDFKQVFLHIIGEPFAGTERMLADLARKHRLMILSNTSQVHWQHCEKMLNLNKYIEKAWLSCDLGFMKPDNRIYEAFLQKIGTDPHNIFYFDDKEENVIAARAFGINAYKSWGGETLTEDLLAANFILEAEIKIQENDYE
jgi:HAD superfamily hydrolase (TIGR01509 family)